MSRNNYNDLPLKQILKKNYNGDFGIELELEYPLNKEIPVNTISQGLIYWKMIPEGSLRNGTEFVIRKEIKHNEETFSNAIHEIKNVLRNYDFTESIRTSTHIHINVLDLTPKQIVNVILNWYLFENLFVFNNGKERRGNLHCLRFSDANGIYYNIKEAIKNASSNFPVTSSFTDQSSIKYSALNLGNLNYLGTLEFRYLKGYSDYTSNDLELNCSCLYKFVHYFKDKNPLEMIKEIESKRIKTLLNKFLTKEEVKFIRRDLEYYEMLNMLTTNISEIESLCKYLNKAQKWINNPTKTYLDGPYKPNFNEDDYSFDEHELLSFEVQDDQ
ncbi:MAG: hypothetical protein KDD45_02410 [Bdellovibrionales bacterium]|nr:hypothetical protein [Bdellovibrionales bacterium]